MLNGDHGAGIQCALQVSAACSPVPVDRPDTPTPLDPPPRQHPYSRGTILINSTAPFDKPLIDPGYFGLGYDIDIMNAGFLFLRTIGATAPLSDCASRLLLFASSRPKLTPASCSGSPVLLAETTPGASVTSDALNTWIKSNGNTEYHPRESFRERPPLSAGTSS